jgi:Lon protease-like protein
VTNFIPIFPLAIVVYPGERLNLHIFEPRYKQLITECHAGGKPFGIPSVLREQVAELGTLVRVEEVAKTYDNGEMDIRVAGISVFRILESTGRVPDKLYNGAIVTYPDNDMTGDPELLQKVVTGLKELHRLMNISKEFPRREQELCSYDLAHLAGLSLEEEYEVLGLMMELQRLEYLRRHLKTALPMAAGLENLREKVKLNGHFRNLTGFDLGPDK